MINTTLTAVQESHDLGTRWPETQDRLIITLPYLEDVDVNLTELSPGEEAVAKTLRGWGAELDNDQKFWWADWTRMTRDVVTAMRTGEPVLYDDEDD